MVVSSLSMTLFSVCVFVYTSPATGLTKPSGVRLKNNGYEGIVVAIHPDEPENTQLIDIIKEMFTNGSEYLYNATKQRAYFKEVTILIPQTWSDNALYTSPGNATFNGADVIVAPFNPRFAPSGENSALPYTKQFAGCGQQSLYIHMTSSFLSNAEHLRFLVGDYGRVLVHEWGHYRWGLFNEYPDTRTDESKANYFYFSDANRIWEPVSCSTGWRLIPLKYTGSAPLYRLCHGDQLSGYERGCISMPEAEQPPHVTGSIMHSYLAFNQVLNFCDSDPDDPSYLHNSEAPNKQNQRCDGKSSWEVMREHPDFSGMTNNPPREVDDVTPRFIVARARIMRVVLVLDTSGSMSKNERYLKLADAARTYIMTVAAPGTFIGIVDFDTSARVVSNVVEMTSDDARRSLANLVPEDAGGDTCIGCGMLQAITILSNLGDVGGSKILLITDGEDTEPQITVAMKERYINRKIIIDSIAFSEEADPNLIDLAESTGGRFYLQTDSNNSTGIRDALSANAGGASDLESRIELQAIVVNFEVGDEEFHGSVYIDSTIGRLTTFDFTYFAANPQSGAAIDVTITSPSGEVFDRSSQSYEEDLIFKKVLIRIPDIAESGSWQYHIQNQNTDRTNAVIVSISSLPSQEGEDPILVSSFLSGSPDDIANNKPLVAYAEVRQKFYPVIGATVIASIETPSGTSVELPLYDNGAGADVTKNDGIYSRYFTQITGVGFYGFKIRVENNGQATVLRPGTSTPYSGIGIYVNPDLLLAGNVTSSVAANLSIALPGAPVPEIIGVPAPNFTRGVSGGASRVSETPEGWDATIDTLQPNKITDLEVVNTSFSLGTVTITFTAPGDDYDFGNAESYNVLWSNSSKDLREKLPTNNRINQSDVVHGNLSLPGMFGEKETVIFPLNPPSHLETYSVSLGIYAVDEAGNEAEMSNIAKVTFRQTIPTAEPPLKTTGKTESSTHKTDPPLKMTITPDLMSTKRPKAFTIIKINDEPENDTAIYDLLKISASVVFVCLLLIALFVLTCFFYNRKKGSRELTTVVPHRESDVELKDA